MPRPHAGRGGRGRHGGGGRRHGGGGRPHRQFYGTPYYWRYSPYDSYYPPSTYIVTQQPQEQEQDQDETKELIENLTESHRRRMRQSRWMMYLVGLLVVILVAALFLKKD